DWSSDVCSSDCRPLRGHRFALVVARLYRIRTPRGQPMTTPKRIRRLRSKGWRRGDAVIVDRTSRYGNPWKVGDPGVPDRQTAVARFAAALEARRAGAVVPELRRLPSDEDIA